MKLFPLAQQRQSFWGGSSTSGREVGEQELHVVLKRERHEFNQRWENCVGLGSLFLVRGRGAMDCFLMLTAVRDFGLI